MCARRCLLPDKDRQTWVDMPFIRKLLIEMIKNYIFRVNILVKWKENSGRIEGICIVEYEKCLENEEGDRWIMVY